MRSTEALLESTDPRWIRVAGMVRRMAISLTSKVLWQLVGFQLPDANGNKVKETINAEAFTGIGFFARPPSSGKPEAIVVSVGDANAPMIIAVRDEKTRAAVMGELGLGETAIYTDKAMVYLKSDGTIEARSANGVAQPLATKADLDALISSFNAHTHLYAPGPGTPVPTAAPVPTAGPSAGTSKLRAE